MVGGDGDAETEIEAESYFLGDLPVRDGIGGRSWSQVCEYYGKDGEGVVKWGFGEYRCLNLTPAYGWVGGKGSF